MRIWVMVIALAVGGCGGDAGQAGDAGTATDASGNGDGNGNGNGNGCMVFPASNAWNTDVSAAKVDAKSAQYIGSIGAALGMHPDFSSVQGGNYGIPYVKVPATQKPVPVTFTDYPDESDPGPYPIPDDAPIEDGGDAHVIVVDCGNGFLYELYQGSKVSGGWQAANGAKWNLTTGAPRPQGWTSADAAGLPIYAGLARYEEVAAGEITHALRFTIEKTQRGYVAPASHAAGSCALDSDCPPMGLRVRLKAGFDVSGFPPQAQVILKALKKYGMIVADNAGTGSNWFISGAPDPGWDDDQLAMLKMVHGSDLEVIETGPITPQ